MRRCFSAPIISRVAGERCSLSLTPGQAILLAIFPIISRAEAALLRLTSFWRGTVALGGLLIEAIGPEAPGGAEKDFAAGGRGRHPRHADFRNAGVHSGRCHRVRAAAA